jgi:hypothetical protein
MKLATKKGPIRGSAPVQMPALELFLRYERHLNRQYEHALRYFESKREE